MTDAILAALTNIFIPAQFGLLILGVLVGLVLGAIPGLGGVVGMTLLLPFLFDLTPHAALTLLVALGSVVNTADTIPAVLFGVPGTAGAQATILDGFPMAKKGQAGRAFGAAYLCSMIGGIIGALVLAVSIPVLSPLVLSFGSPELFMMALLGITMISTLTGRVPLAGLAMGSLGILLSVIGMDPQTGHYRWSLGIPYLLDGIPLVPALLGVFAIPEIAALAILGTPITGQMQNIGKGIWQGMKDALHHWFLVLRTSLLGVWVGIVPGMGVSSAVWVAYGHTVQSSKDKENFGQGDVRGVIGPESANNAKMAGSLIPTLAFGVPGSAMCIIILAAFTIFGLVPGPDMLTKHLDITLTLVWVVAIANIIGASLCLALSSQLVRVCRVRIHLLAPLVIVAVFIAAIRVTGNLWDLYALLFFGALGWILKRIDWARPPLILGLVLGPILKKYLFISTMAYGAAWLVRPGVLVIALMTLGSLVLGSRMGRR